MKQRESNLLRSPKVVGWLDGSFCSSVSLILMKLMMTIINFKAAISITIAIAVLEVSVEFTHERVVFGHLIIRRCEERSIVVGSIWLTLIIFTKGRG